MIPHRCMSSLEQTQAIVRDYVRDIREVPTCSVFYIPAEGFSLAQYDSEVTETEFFTGSISYANASELDEFISVHPCHIVEEMGECRLPLTKEDLHNEDSLDCVVALIYMRDGKFKFRCASIWVALVNLNVGKVYQWDEYDSVSFQKKA